MQQACVTDALGYNPRDAICCAREPNGVLYWDYLTLLSPRRHLQFSHTVKDGGPQAPDALQGAFT